MSMWKTEQLEHLPNGYNKLDCCANCDNCFIETEYDSDDQYHCTLNATKRPPCLSVFMEEVPTPRISNKGNWEDWHSKHAVWEDWSDKYCVEAWGHCPQHKTKGAAQ